MRRFHLGTLVVLALAALVGAGCGDDDGGGKSGSSSVDTIKKGTLTIGSDIPYKPFEFGKAPNYQGFDVDVVNEIAKRLKLKPSFQKTPFDTIFRNLAQGKFDMVASSVTITDERKKAVAFSAPYFPSDQSIMVKKGSPIRTLADLNGKTLGAQLGTTGADYAKKKVKAKSVRTYDLVDDAFQALEAGQVEAVVNDFPVSKYAERAHKDLQVVKTIPTGEKYGFAFPKGSSKLREAVDEQLSALKSDGTYARIYRRWFSVAPPKSILK